MITTKDNVLANEIIVKVQEEFFITIDDGEAVRLAVKDVLLQGKGAVIDFTKVKLYFSPAVTTAIGKLYKDFYPQVIENRLRCIGTTDVGENLIAITKKNAIRYYALAPGAKKRVDDLFDEISEVGVDAYFGR